MVGPIAKAFFLDIPSVIDSAWRYIELTLSAECKYEPGAAPPITTRPFWVKPPLLFFAITVFFVSYGPTWDGLCAIAPKEAIDFLRHGLGVLIVIGALALAAFLAWKATGLIGRRFAKVAHDEHVQVPQISLWRRVPVFIVIYLGPLLLLIAGVLTGRYLYYPSSDDGVCGTEGPNPVAGAQLVLCVAAILAFALIASSRRARVKVDVVAQAVILAAVALIQWYGLTTPLNKEASDLPYRHLFLVWAPCIVAVVAFAPWMARRVFQGNSGVSEDVRQGFRQLLRDTELFIKPEDPDLTYRRIISAIVYGPAYHPLHLLLFPALVALVAPAKWLYLFAFLAFLVSFLLLVWGNVSSRWQQLNTYFERAFLSGTPLIISLFVIVVAVLRVVQFDYISTILDAMPFGTVFGLVVMNYVLFWLVEYWMNRVAALELLEVLGAPTDEVRVPYLRSAVTQGIRVLLGERYLESHGSGRFLVVGTVGDPQPPVPAQPPVTAFQTYYLAEVISLLGSHTGDNAKRDHERASDINQRAGLYFFLLNCGIFLVTAVFVGMYLYVQLANNAVDPVVTVEAAPPAALVDLPSMLQQKQGEPTRAAIVVVGSGGGTRAALYTASVLNGLHRMGLDRDIVLLSGVSGGGVALAYFAAKSDVLTAPGTPSQAGHCPDKKDAKRSVEDEWDCFNKGVTKSFIGDVLNGATEWRVFRTTALSVLLAESFERHLMRQKPLLGSLPGPALILNSAIVGHPADESVALSRTIDSTDSCEEAERPFSMMNGGRLIFTNLRNIDAFPGQDGQESPIPDVRLPYRIVQGASVPLASAAALNANFPPVFPNARVLFRDKNAQPCQDRSFYVSDGGAEENLGLISALYALESALAKIPKGAVVRPIHVVIAEASAVTYDYSQDRGLSAALSGSRERLAGGLANTQLDKMKLQSRDGAEASVQFHYLGLPLAFRARGGFGTHWMYAKEFHLNDPRPRTATGLNFLPNAGLSERKAAINRANLEELWLALHDPDDLFCTTKRFDGSDAKDAKKVQGWICGVGANGRDLHMENWQGLVKALRPKP